MVSNKGCYMFKVFRLKAVVIVLVMVCVSVLLSVGVVSITNNEVPKTTYTIVIDAGHGGRDDGCSGAGGTKESGVNLKIAKKLQSSLEKLGINVVMTRNDGNGL